MNKCEELNMAHAWRGGNEMYGFDLIHTETCANCQLKRTRCSNTEEWWVYTDGRPNEPIINIRPV